MQTVRGRADAPRAARPRLAATWSLVALAFIATVAAAKLAGAIVAPTVLACLIALTLTPVVSALERLRLPAVAAALIVVGSVGGIAAGGIYMLAPSYEDWGARAPQVVRSMERHLRDIERQISEKVDTVTPGPPQMKSGGAGQLDKSAGGGKLDALVGEKAEAKATKQADGASPAATVIQSGQRLLTDLVFSAPQALAGLLYVIALSFFLLAERASLRRFALSLPTRTADRLDLARAIRRLPHNVSVYLLTVSTINTLLGASAAAAFWAWGLPNPIMWGVMVALLNFIPYLGPMIANVIIFAVGIVTYDHVVQATYPVLTLAALNMIEGQFVTPMTIGRQVRVGGLPVFFVVTFGAWLWGAVGALVATPLLVVGIRVWRDLNRQKQAARRNPAPGRQAA